MNNNTMELNLEEMELIDGGWHWAGAVLGGVTSAFAGAVAGAYAAGPIGAVVGGVAGAAIGAIVCGH